MIGAACPKPERDLPETIDSFGVASAKMLTGSQMRAARAMLRWRLVDIAEKAGISFAAVQRAEASEGVPDMHVRNLIAIKQAYEKAGIIFLDRDVVGRVGPGVRLRK